MPDYLLPSNVETLTGACAAHGWILCWGEVADREDYGTYAWSPGSGWIQLHKGERTLSFTTSAHAMGDGILLLNEETEEVGFWPYGSNSWA